MVLFASQVVLTGIKVQYRWEKNQYRYEKNQYRYEKKSIPQMTFLYRRGINAKQYQLVLSQH